MSEDHNEHQHLHMNIPKYIGVFLILAVGTILTYTIALYDLDDMFFPGANTFVALLIAFIKMLCVMLFFMHVYWSPRLIRLAIIASFFWLLVMFAFTMGDYLTRGLGVFGQ